MGSKELVELLLLKRTDVGKELAIKYLVDRLDRNWRLSPTPDRIWPLDARGFFFC
jgi:hypothetical protein